MDISYLIWLQNLRQGMGGVFDNFFEQISNIAISTVLLGIIVLLYWCVAKEGATWIMMNWTGSNIINNAIKLTACVYRPWIRDTRIVPAGNAIATAGNYSFPSGHSQQTVAIFGTLAAWKRKHKWLVALCVIFIALVMFSRNYLGVHTPQDVIVGCALGCVIIFINSRLIRWMNEKKNRDIIVMIFALALGAAALIFCHFKSYPMDYNAAGELLVDPNEMKESMYTLQGLYFGYWIGYVMERHFVNFKMPATILGRIVRGVVGMILLVVVYVVAKKLLAPLGPEGQSLVGKTILMFYIVFLYPLLFQFVETKGKRK